MTEDLNKGRGKGSNDSEDSTNKKIKDQRAGNVKSGVSDESAISEMVSSLRKFTMADELEEASPSKSRTPANKDPEDKSKKEEHSFHIGNIFGHKAFDKLKSKKDKIVKYGALLIGVFLIIYGLVLISSSVTRVADNVIFGEKAMWSTFLILLGVLVILAAFAKTILNKTFLNKIHTQLEVAEGRTGSDKDSNKEDENANKVGKDKE